ncbi:hypothetical protein ACFQ3N_07330 [Virgibacillus byunsanensis]|uniref:ClpX-type ZB domain-containing protein n=1 Tax=Virgibacillus byunsanensis TaxID=570945 RepID=A0ABW3LIT3_9BACI
MIEGSVHELRMKGAIYVHLSEEEFERAMKWYEGVDKYETRCFKCKEVVWESDCTLVTDGKEVFLEVCKECVGYYIDLKKQLEDEQKESL